MQADAPSLGDYPGTSGDAAPGRTGRTGAAGTADTFRRSVRTVVGLLLGFATAVVSLAYLVLAAAGLAPWLLPARTRPAALRLLARGAQRLTELERWRLATFLGSASAESYDGRQALRYLVARTLAGLLAGILLVFLGFGLLLAALLVRGGIAGTVGPGYLAVQAVLGLVLLFLNVAGLAAVADLDRRLVHRFLGPNERELLERRIAELAASRAGIVAAVDAERRRIERDLHDGVQQSLVALAMLLGRARRAQDPAKLDELVRSAHEESQRVLGELRDVAWRAYPTALDSLGLEAALAAVAERCSLPVTIRCDLAGRPPAQVETAAYFIVSEAVTNAAKHASASAVDVRVRQDGDSILVEVTDDGVGGADHAGSGLAGLARRAAALDGSLRVHSPPGGPTTVVAWLPCG
jgi:signal transduction histidine kinase